MVNGASRTKVYQQCWKEWDGWCTQEGVRNNVIFAPNEQICVHLVKVGLAWHTIDI